MAKKLWKAGALLAPVPPALITCGTLETPNILTVAWTGTCNTVPPMTYISLRPGRYSYPIIRDSGEFVINLTTAALVRAADLCGVRTGADTDKLTLTGLTVEKAANVAAPLLTQSPVSLECRVRQVIPLGTHDMFLSEIVAVDVDEEFIDEKGKLRLDRCGLAAYAHGEYFALGKKIGSFGFSVRRRKRQQPKKHR